MGTHRSSPISVACPRCRADTETRGKTQRNGKGSVKRSRVCTNCRVAFDTEERVLSSTIRERRERIYPLGDQLDEPFGVRGDTLTVPPVGRDSRWRNAVDRMEMDDG